MERRSRSTSALLQKVSSQLRGERVPLKTKDEDELDNYLSTLSKKTSQTAKPVNFQDFGTISISSDDPPSSSDNVRLGSVGNGSKFLKTKSPESNENEKVAKTKEQTMVHITGSKTAMEPQYLLESQQSVSSSPALRPVTARGRPAASGRDSRLGQASPGLRGTSPALSKAAALNQKMSQRVSKVIPHTDDLDESTSTSGPFEGQNERPQSRRQRHRPASAMTLDSLQESQSDSSLGQDGNKFIRRSAVTGAKAESPVNKEGVSRTKQKAATATENKPSQQEKAGRGKTKSRRQNSTVNLTSEEESLAEFIRGLSPSSSDPVSSMQYRSGKTSEKVKSQRKIQPLPRTVSPQRRTPSPLESQRGSPSHLVRRSSSKSLRQSASMDSDLVESISSEVAEDAMLGSLRFSASNDIFEGVNLMDIDSLEPVLSPQSPKKVTFPLPGEISKHGKPKKKSKSSLKSSPPEKTDRLAALGVHTVEELFASAPDTITNGKASKFRSEKSGFFAFKPRQDDPPSRNVSEDHSLEEPIHMLPDSEESISENIGEDIRDVSSASEIHTISSEKETESEEYSEDFDSYARSGVESRPSTLESQSQTSYSDTDSYSSQSEASAKGQPHGRRQVVIDTRSVEIQTQDVKGLEFRWNLLHHGLAISGPSQGLGYVEAAPIATHVVGADALETMTAYSPALLALHQMLRQQLDLTRDFIETQKRLYQAFTDPIIPDYHYTTLEETKEYIKKHRKPRLTFKQALKMVNREMNR